MKNKKAQAAIAGFGVAVIVFISLVVMIEPMKELIDIARDSSHLDCSNSSISTGTKASCIIIDFWLPYFSMIVLGIAGAYVMGKKI